MVHTRFGFHVIQLVEPARHRTRPLEQVEATIRQVLQRRSVEELTAELREKAKIEIHLARVEEG